MWSLSRPGDFWLETLVKAEARMRSEISRTCELDKTEHVVRLDALEAGLSSDEQRDESRETREGQHAESPGSDSQDDEPQPRQLPGGVTGCMTGQTYEFELDGVEKSKQLQDGTHSLWLKDSAKDGWSGGMDAIWTAQNGVPQHCRSADALIHSDTCYHEGILTASTNG